MFLEQETSLGIHTKFKKKKKKKYPTNPKLRPVQG